MMVLYARDIVEKDFLTMSASSTVLEGAKAMRDSHHGFAVIGTPGQPQGIVTEWDILSKVVAAGRDPEKVTLSEVMSSNLLSIDKDAPLSEVSQIMTERGVRRLLVKDGNQVIGFITSKTMMARMNEYVDKVSTQISRLQAPWF
jgi:CBS domain-containing protein